jgi:uncharacterized protein
MVRPNFRFILYALSLLLVHTAWAQQPIPALTARVTDQTATLGAAEVAELGRSLEALEQRHGSQIAVLIVSTTEPETIEQYSIRVAESWKIGRRGVEDGVIIVVAKNDRRVRIEVGYGLEGAIPDAVAKRIIAEQILPNFKSGNYFEGIRSGVRALSSVIAGEPLPPPSPSGASGATGQLDISSLLYFAMFLVFFVAGPLSATFGDFASASLLSGFVFLVSLLAAPFILSLVFACLMFLAVFFLGHTAGQLATPRRGGRYYGPMGWGSIGGSGSGPSVFRGGGGGFGGGGASGSW